MPTKKTTAPENEVTGGDTVEFDWDGITVTIPADLEGLDVDAVEAFEDGKAITACRMILGSDQYDRVRKEWAAKHGHKATLGDIGNMYDSIAKAYGFDSAGE